MWKVHRDAGNRRFILNGGSLVLLPGLLWFRPALAIFYGSRRTAQNGENLGHVYDVMQIKTR